MPHVVPNFNDDQIARILKENYDLEGDVSSLVSFEDQNAKIKTADKKYTLKIANQVWAKDFIEMQTDVLLHLKRTAPELTLPSVIKTLNGENMIEVDGFTIRLLSYLEGDILANIERSPELYRDVGRFLGQFSNAMQGYDHSGREGSDPNWKLDNVAVCKQFLPEVIDEDARDRITRLYEVYDADIKPKAMKLRKAVLHGDANEQNFLINPDQPTQIAGLIDFGEMQYGAQINELAITMAYSLLDEDNLDMAANNMIEGYVKEYELEKQELDILYDLIAMRLVTNITMTSHSFNQQPDNEYILISQGPARVLLKRLEDEKYIMK